MSGCRRSAVVLGFVSLLALLPPAGAQAASAAPRLRSGAAETRDAWTFPHAFWHFLTSLRGLSGAKIDGNG